MIPKENEKDLKEVPNNVKKVLEIIPAEHVDEVLQHALCIKDLSELYKNKKDGVDLLDIYDTGEEKTTTKAKGSDKASAPAAH